MEQELKRYRVFEAGLILAFSLIIIFSFKLQIFEGKKYYRLAEENRIKKKYIMAPRGKIFDRNGKEIANTRPGFYASIIPALIDSFTIEKLAQILNIDKSRIIAKINLEKNPYVSLKIAHDITIAQLSLLEESIEELRGIEVGVEPLRNYPYNELFSHALGYVDEITKEEIKNLPSYKTGDYIGRSGLEKVYESHLKGKDGIEYIEVDVRGKEVGRLSEYRPLPVEPGKDLWTTLDLELAESTAVFMKEYERGAAVAFNPQNGEVYLLFSKPVFDPNKFISGLSDSEWQALNNPKVAPLLNRATMSCYPIGSTIKPFIALAALDANLIKVEKTFSPCKGVYYLGKRPFRCWKIHGQLSLIDAIINSCDIYFYQLGRFIGIDIIAEYLNKFGFGKETGIDLIPENRGILPDRKWFENKYGKNWTEGHIFNLSIGQGDILATPLQLACAYSVFANDGKIAIPHLTKIDRKQKREILIDKKAVETIKKALSGVVARGTGVLARVLDIEICGKTGTAENPHGEDHSIFVGFAPAQNPEILVCVIVENAGHGGSIAAPIAGKIIKTFLLKNKLITVK
uniref:Penicillin-binding protein 2 n=1 Tax=candidate division WOR-3 bacterium TaxID=2052148 RepID=A0A7C4TFH7_UNCW3